MSDLLAGYDSEQIHFYEGCDPDRIRTKETYERVRKLWEEKKAVTEEERRRREEAENQRKEQEGIEAVESFWREIQTPNYKPIPSGIKAIDEALNGGFMRQRLILLGAAPGAGKTALSQWIFENMAKSGISCVYLNLEMSREQILARSLSRIAARNGVKVNSDTILKGYQWTEGQRAALEEAKNEYIKTIAPCMTYNPNGVSSSLDSILVYIEGEAKRAEDAGMAAPVIVLDYLQIIRGGEREDPANLIKRAVFELKDFAKRHNTFVFVIIAHNRTSNASGMVSMESGRDSSALEYSADLQMALTFTKCLKRDGVKGKTPDELTAEDRKFLTLKLVKGRFGGVGREVDLFFDGETMTFGEIAKDFCDIAEGDIMSQSKPRRRF